MFCYILGNFPADLLKKSSVTAKISKHSREDGCKPRHVVVRRRVGTGDDTVLKYARIPCATPEIYASKTGSAQVDYQGNKWDVITGHPEDYD